MVWFLLHNSAAGVHVHATVCCVKNTHIALTQKSCVCEIFVTVLFRSSPAHQETLVKLYTLNPSQKKKKHIKTGELPLSVV